MPTRINESTTLAFALLYPLERAMYVTMEDHLRFYRKFALDWWNNVGPYEYVILLMMVGVIGFVMMRKAARL